MFSSDKEFESNEPVVERDINQNDETSDPHNNNRADIEQELQSLSDGEKETTSAASSPRQYQVANFWDVLCFGICLVSANITYGAWHAGLVLGFWSFFYGVIIMTTVFVCIHLCIAEMISILPFSGGMYGFARVTLGPFIGFMVGAFESTANILYTMYGIAVLGAYFTYMTGWDRKYEPIYWLIFYLIIITNELLGRSYYFHFLRLIAVLIVLIFLFYTAESIPLVHPLKYISADDSLDPYHYGGDLAVAALQYPAFLYFGIEIIPLVSDEVKEPRKTTPRALVGTLTFLIIFTFLFMFLNYCQYPGYPLDIRRSAAPLNSGFTNTFRISDRSATAFAYLPLLATVSIYVFGFAKQMKALGSSRLLPPCFAWTVPNTAVPWVSLVVGSLIGYSILLLAYFQNDLYTNEKIPTQLYLLGYLFTYFTFFGILMSFIIFRVKYWTLPRAFTNPLGIYGAIYGIFGMLLLLAILFKYGSGQFRFAKIFACYVGILSLFYIGYARSRQVFSEQEQNILFKVYVMKANERKRQGLFHRNIKSTTSHRVAVEMRTNRRVDPSSTSSASHSTGHCQPQQREGEGKNEESSSAHQGSGFFRPAALDFSKMFKAGGGAKAGSASSQTVTPTTVTTRRIHPYLASSSSHHEGISEEVDPEANTCTEDFRT